MSGVCCKLIVASLKFITDNLISYLPDWRGVDVESRPYCMWFICKNEYCQYLVKNKTKALASRSLFFTQVRSNLLVSISAFQDNPVCKWLAAFDFATCDFQGFLKIHPLDTCEVNVQVKYSLIQIWKQITVQGKSTHRPVVRSHRVLL